MVASRVQKRGSITLVSQHDHTPLRAQGVEANFIGLVHLLQGMRGVPERNPGRKKPKETKK
jgi:hypothetical protein